MTGTCFNPGGCVGCDTCRISPTNCPQCQETAAWCDGCGERIPLDMIGSFHREKEYRSYDLCEECLKKAEQEDENEAV